MKHKFKNHTERYILNYRLSPIYSTTFGYMSYDNVRVLLYYHHIKFVRAWRLAFIFTLKLYLCSTIV